ncbi:MAG TPA: nuclear transport factor 2 family protein [Pedobacter sp.]
MKFTYVLFLVLVTGMSVKAQVAKDKKQIEASIISFFEGMSVTSETQMKAELTPDFILVEHGLIWNADSLITHLKPMIGRNVKRVNRLVFDITSQTGDLATVVYHNSADFITGEKKQTVNWLESAVVVRQAGRWKIKLLHSTTLK